MRTSKVYVTSIEHKHGTNFYVNRSKQGAVNALYDYVEEWWDEAVPAGCGPISDYDKATAIEMYFENNGYESWTMDESTIMP